MHTKNIVITSYFFYPENTPRAFRTFELAKEFAKRGYNVLVFIPNYDYNYSEIENQYNFKVIKVKTGFLFNRNAKKQSNVAVKQSSKKPFYINIMKWLYFGHRTFEFSFYLFYNLIKKIKKKSTIISISLPVNTVLSSYLFIKFKPSKVDKLIADYGDPYSGNSALNIPNWHKWVEKKILKKINWITIPIEPAKKAYSNIIEERKIKIIPQGFNFDDITVEEYKKHDIPHFAYAGVFYGDIRNPQNIMEYLSRTPTKFKFVIYTQKINHNIQIEDYKKLLGNKLEIIYNKQRLELIRELSRYDFLININNTNETQLPSKLIDYTLAQRPILSLDPKNFDEKKLNMFLNGNYTTQDKIIIDQHDIKSVVSKFELLIK